MPIELIYLGIIFAVIIILLAIQRPLYQAILGGLLFSVLLYRIPPPEILKRTSQVVLDWNSFSIIVSLYLITYLQQMLNKRNLIKLAENDLKQLFRSLRANVLMTSAFFGLLPSAAATILCGDVVSAATDKYLDKKEQAFITSWYRHIPESTMPTYSFILLFATLAGVPIAQYVVGMTIPILFLIMVGYYPYLTKLPRRATAPSTISKKDAARNLFKHIWPILLILVLILAGGMSVVSSVLISIIATTFLYKFSPSELCSLVKEAFDAPMIVNSFLCLVLKEFITYASVLELLPETLAKLPIPDYLIYALIFFIGGMINMNGIIAITTPLAFATCQGNVALMILLMSVCHAASQISPTHICVILAAEHFHISVGELIRKLLPRSLLFIGMIIVYYNLLLL